VPRPANASSAFGKRDLNGLSKNMMLVLYGNPALPHNQKSDD
jgi:hypothetical protein